MSVSINGTSGLVFNDASTQNTAATGFGFKNRILNGNMVLDQRNAGAAVTLTSAGAYTVDRWQGFEDTDGVMTAQQSSVAPAGFTNSLLFTTTTADASLGATQFACVLQKIEGFNTADLGWGTANAQPITLSFWVRSSLTGTFGGSFNNAGFNRYYPFSYTISTANTWEQKTVTVAGDTTGTWNTTNGIGIQVNFGLGVGSTYSGTAGSWGSTLYLSTTGATSVIGTLSATWQVTGVQLEKGSTATSFDYRPYGSELALCQRYCINYNSATSSGGYYRFGISQNVSNVTVEMVSSFPVPMRASPSLTVSSTASQYGVYQNSSVITCTLVPAIDVSASNTLAATAQFRFSSGAVTQGLASSCLATNNTLAYLLYTAEL